MSKNLTRKGLALGAIVALASTVIAGSPAFAAGEITVAPSAGTSLNIASYATSNTSSVFNLKTTLAAGFTPASYAQLKYIIKTDANSAITYGAGVAAVTAPAIVQAVSVTSTAIAATGATSTSVNYLGLSATTTSVTSNVEVTAFVDANNDSALTAGEWNTVKTVSFKKNADIVPVVTLTAPAAGDTSAKATVAWGDLNIEQMATQTVKFKVGAAVLAPGTLATGVWSLDIADPYAVAASTITAQAYNDTVALGTAASATVSARTISQPTAAVVAGVNGLATNKARTNSAFAVAATVKDVATPSVVKAGVTLKAAITVSGALLLSATKTLSINGTVYNGTVALPASIDVVSDAAGLATVNLVTFGFDQADGVSVVFTAQNLNSVLVAVDLQDAIYTVKSTSAFASTERSIVEGGSTTLTYVVKDQFGVALAAPSRLKFVVGYGVTTATAAATTYVPLVGGSASITVTDTTASTVTPIVVAAGLQIQDATSLNYLPETTAVNADPHNVNVTATAAAFTTAGTPAATFTAAVDGLATLATVAPAAALAINNAGGLVTIAATGVTFTVNGVDYANTVTVITGTLGAVPAVTAKSTTAGAKNITFTVGTNVTTSVLTVSAAVETSGTVLTLDAPATILPGRTLVVTGKLVDKFGNPVNTTLGAVSTLAVVYTGPGLIVGSLPTETDATGAFSFRVLLGANETGSASVSASYDADGVTVVTGGVTTGAGVAIAAAKTIAIGAVEVKAAVIASKNGRVYVTINSAAGFKASVKVGTSQKAAFKTTGSNLVSYYVGAGKRVAVVVTVRGGVVASQAVTVN